MSVTYMDLLRDPRWQRKRLEVMQRADFKCEKCGAADRTLNVHHPFYKRGAKPWEYEATELQCICEQCHADEHRPTQEQIAVKIKALPALMGQLDNADKKARLIAEARPLLDDIEDDATHYNLCEFLGTVIGISGRRFTAIIGQCFRQQAIPDGEGTP